MLLYLLIPDLNVIELVQFARDRRDAHELYAERYVASRRSRKSVLASR